MRIASLLPSATEIICALGFENQLVGRSHECDFPPSVKHLPILTRSRVPDESSRIIDELVKRQLQKALSIYEVDQVLLKTLKPDFIVTQSLCEVCAVNFSQVQETIRRELSDSTQIIDLQPNQLDDLFEDIRRTGDRLGAPQQAVVVINALRKRMDQIGAAAQAESARPRVACIEWLDPLMDAGNWIPELVDWAGGVDVFGNSGSRSHYLTWEDLLREDPDIIILMPCGFSMSRTKEELPVLTRHPQWGTLAAVQNQRVFLTDGNQYFNRPGPRIVESLRILAEIFHPEKLAPEMQGHGWQIIA